MNEPRSDQEVIEIIKVVEKYIVEMDPSKFTSMMIHYPAIRECLLELLNHRQDKRGYQDSIKTPKD